MRGDAEHLSLFRSYPQLGKKLAVMHLGSYPTPVHRLRVPDAADLWIKRDDLTSPVYGGNKIRKLEFILAAARRKNARHLVTLGGIGTNHGLATAIFGQQLGIQCTVLLYRQPVTRSVKRSLLLLNRYNARLIYVGTLLGAMLCYYSIYRLRHPGAYFVYPGGSSPIGNIGYVNAAFELKDQIDRGMMPEPTVIFCPLGSGGSLAGLALGLQLAGLMNSRLIGVRVMPSHLGPFQACTPHTVAKQIKRTYAYLRARCRQLPELSIRQPEILGDYLGVGYGASTEAGNRACHLMQETGGIILDVTYTAKTVAAVMDYCRDQHALNRPILYWHTYNSVDLSEQARDVEVRDLPRSLQGFFE